MSNTTTMDIENVTAGETVNETSTATAKAAGAAQIYYGLDSDEENLRYEENDDLYASDADEADAIWVRKQHLPAAEFEKDKQDFESGRRQNYDGQDSGSGEDDSDNGDVSQTANSQSTRSARGNNTGVEDKESAQDHEGRQQEQQQPRRAGKAKKAKKRTNFSQGKALGVESDAQLSCPLCFTTVCLECQRHARYHTQFRAVNAINVIVRDDESLLPEDVSGHSKKRSTRKRNSGVGGRDGGGNHYQEESQRSAAGGAGHEQRVRTGVEGEGEAEVYHPVCCAGCDHRVGVMDKDEVYHFFGVIASG